MSGRKRTHDENLPATPQNKSFTFVDGFAPKKPHLSAKNARQFTSQEIQNIQRDCEAQHLMQAREKEELVAKKKEELDVEQLRVVWQSIRGAGFKGLSLFLSHPTAGEGKNTGSFHFQSQHPQQHLCHKEPHVEHQVAIQMVACGRSGSLSLPASRCLPLPVCSGEPLRGKPW
jgi:hypothetical protein